MKYYINLDLNGLELSNAKIQPLRKVDIDVLKEELSEDDLGRIYVSKDSKKLVMFDGQDFVDVGVRITDDQQGDGIIDVDGESITVYSLPTATSSILGGIRVGQYLQIENGLLKAYHVKDVSNDESKVVTGLSYNANQLQSIPHQTSVSNLTVSDIDESISVAKNNDTIRKIFERTKEYIDNAVIDDSDTHLLGVTSTDISTDPTISEIKINGKLVTPEFADIVIYNDIFYVWCNNRWYKSAYTFNDVPNTIYKVITGYTNGENNTGSFIQTDVSVLSLSLTERDESVSVAKNKDTLKSAFEHTKSYVDNAIKSNGIIYFIGDTSTEIYNGSITNPVEIDGTDHLVFEYELVRYNGIPYIFYNNRWTKYGYSTIDSENVNSKVITSVSNNINSQETSFSKTDVKSLVMDDIKNTDTVHSGDTLYDAFDRTKHYIDVKTAASGILHYIGTTITDITNGSTTNPVIIKYGNTEKSVIAQATDIVQYEDLEFMWANNKWNKFGSGVEMSVTGTCLNITIK